MEARDLIVTPLLIILIYLISYIVRPWVTDDINRRYFFPGLTVKIIGALALGFIYQFYYDGGDTYNYHTHGSRHVWEAFMESPEKGLKLLFSDKTDLKGIYKYASRIPFFNDQSSYTVIQVAAIFDLITFSTYSATAVCFAIMSFIGSWMMFLTFYHSRPDYVRYIAIATLFIPSVFFWGSGLLKDTITLSFLGSATYFTRRIFIQHRFGLMSLLMLLLSLFIIYSVKKYILLCFLPAVLLWVYSSNLARIRSFLFRLMLLPLLVFVMAVSGYVAVMQVGKDDPRYNLQRIGHTARETAYDIAYWTGKDAGSSYTLGELDGSFQSLIKLAPQAINVALFRPYLWEVSNPLMLISALESLLLLGCTMFVLFKCRGVLSKAFVHPDVLFCLVFSITFAFAVGVSTFNFGTLSRYKIPLLPFYLLCLIFIYILQKEKEMFSYSTEPNMPGRLSASPSDR